MTFGTHTPRRALRTGINPKIISHRLGHGSVAFTLSVYSHVTPGMDRDAADEIAGLFMRTRDGLDEVSA